MMSRFGNSSEASWGSTVTGVVGQTVSNGTQKRQGLPTFIEFIDEPVGYCQRTSCSLKPSQPESGFSVKG